MDSMDSLHWPLSVLSKAVHFKNLTSASAHVGLSQPQLSRLVSQLEKEFNITLLDRAARRKSGWTPTAFQLAEIYSKNSRRLQDALHEALEAQIPQHVRIGTLEGLSYIGINLSKVLFEKSKVEHVELDIYDQDGLEKRFLNGDLDLILTSRSPGKQKYKHIYELGYQNFKSVDTQTELAVLSPYEYQSLKRKNEEGERMFISNSLAIRKTWLDKNGGVGKIPADVQRDKAQTDHEVLLIGTELFHEALWDLVASHGTEIIKT